MGVPWPSTGSGSPKRRISQPPGRFRWPLVHIGVRIWTSECILSAPSCVDGYSGPVLRPLRLTVPLLQAATRTPLRSNGITMATFGKLLIVDDDADVLHALQLLLKKHASTVHTERNPERVPSLMHNTSYDLILLDMNSTRM